LPEALRQPVENSNYTLRETAERFVKERGAFMKII